MKNIFFLFLAIGAIYSADAQLKVTSKCNAFAIDILGGRVNDVHPDFTNGQIKSKLPCFTGEDPESAKCGGVIYYKDKDIKFFTSRDYVEIGPAFKGKLTLPLMGGKRGSFFKSLGLPKLKDDTWDAFQTQYGCLILYYNKSSRVNRIQFSTQSTDELKLCE